MHKFIVIICIAFSCSYGFTQDSIPKTSTEPGNDLKNLTLDEVPIFPGCKHKKSEDKRKKCMSDKVSKFISKKYNVDIFEELNFPDGKYTVTIFFKINKQGKVIEASARGPHYLLEKEAIRVINNLPKVIPGKVDGQPVIIPFAIPIYLSTK